MGHAARNPYDSNHSTPVHTQGELVDYGAAKLRYVKNGGASSSVYGAAALHKDGGAFGEMSTVAATSLKGTLDDAHPVAGVWMDVVEAGKFGFIMVDGELDNALLATGVLKGDPLVCGGGATPNFTGTKATTTTDPFVTYAWALEDESSNAGKIRVCARG